MMQTQHCDRCNAQWQIYWKCQIICPNCGARQDCSDLFVDTVLVQDQRRDPIAKEDTPPC